MRFKIIAGILAFVLIAVLIIQYGFSFGVDSSVSIPASPLFANVSYQAGVTHNRQSFEHVIGIAWGDVDNDGWVDLYVTDSKYPNTLYLNQGDGTFIKAENQETIALATLESGGAIFADYDNDGWQDLAVVGWGPNTLFHNEGNGVFVDVTAASGIVAGEANSKSASWGDFDQDGFLDLYIANWSCYPRCGRPSAGESDELYHNNGDGTFSNVTNLLGSKVEGAGFIASFTDYDNDGDLDIYVVNDEFIHPVGNALWRNDGPGCGGWCFTEYSKAANADTQLMGMGLATTDYDNDGDFDYYFSNAGPMTLLKNQGNGTFEDVATELGVTSSQRVSFGAVAFDANNDGWQDLYVAIAAFVGDANVAGNVFYLNNGDGTFNELCCNSGLADPSPTLGLATADYDQDGWVDVAIGSFTEGYKLYQNQAVAAEHHWVSFTFEGNGPINRDAIGVKLKLTAGGVTQYQELQAGSSVGAGNELALHFGLGTTETITKVEVIWPDGTVQVLTDVEPDQRVHIIYLQD